MNNSLAEVHPELVSEWSEKNLTLTPDDITFGSNKKVCWRGACGHEWQASVKARSNGEKCPIKQLEKSKKSIKQKLDKLNDQTKKDDVVTFEELGVDRLFVDESHYYKNLYLYTIVAIEESLAECK